MPDLRATGMAVSPREHPLTYPGEPVSQSTLIVDSWLYRLDAIAGQGIAEWPVTVDLGPLDLTRTLDLDEALAACGGALMAVRTPVLAIGSNASPGQIASKYRGSDERTVIPLTHVAVEGIRAVHSAHISAPGYVPIVPQLEPGERSSLFVLWLDPEQLRQMDVTEPNYRRQELPTATSARLDTGDEIAHCHLYRGRWGVLRAAPAAAPLRATSQTAVFEFLSALPWFRALVPAIDESPAAAASFLAARPEVREATRHAFLEHDLVISDAFTLGSRGTTP